MMGTWVEKGCMKGRMVQEKQTEKKVVGGGHSCLELVLVPGRDWVMDGEG